MALDFPAEPEDGDVHDNFYWDATAGIWRRLLTVTYLDNIQDVSADSPADNDLLVYDDATSQWVSQEVTYSINDLTSLDSDNIVTAPNYDIDVTTSNNPGTLNLDFSDGTGLVDVSITSALTFTGNNYRPGAIKTIRIVNNGASALNLNFPSNWVFVGLKPTSIFTGKNGILTMTSFTSSDTGCVAAYIEEL